MLPLWIEDRIELFINEEQIYNENIRIKFEKWIHSKNYTLPKTNKECDSRINEFMKEKHIRYKNCKSNSSIKVIDLNRITNKTALTLLK
jgi:hypothetical protein